MAVPRLHRQEHQRRLSGAQKVRISRMIRTLPTPWLPSRTCSDMGMSGILGFSTCALFLRLLVKAGPLTAPRGTPKLEAQWRSHANADQGQAGGRLVRKDGDG